MAENSIKLSDFGAGGLQELFDHEFEKILDNIKDPNTDPKTQRKINIAITIKPDETRVLGNVDIRVTHTSAPVIGLGTNILFEKDAKGKVSAREITERIAGQVEMTNLIEMKRMKEEVAQ